MIVNFIIALVVTILGTLGVGLLFFGIYEASDHPEKWMKNMKKK